MYINVILDVRLHLALFITVKLAGSFIIILAAAQHSGKHNRNGAGSIKILLFTISCLCTCSIGKYGQR